MLPASASSAVVSDHVQQRDDGIRARTKARWTSTTMRPSTGSDGPGTNPIMVRRRRIQAAIERRAGGFDPSDRMCREPGAIRVVVHRRRDVAVRYDIP
jgi:hypothetical protein